MRIEPDPAKSQRDVQERGLPFELVAQFDFATAQVWLDMRKAYPETRFVALGFVDERLHVLCFTPLADGLRVISFRKANKREVCAYDRQNSTRE